MNNRQRRIYYRKNKDTITPVWLWTKRIFWLVVLVGMMLFIVDKMLLAASDQVCQSATPNYAQQIGCDK